MTPTTLKLRKTKETPNKAVFSEVVQPGKPPVLEGVYLPKWFVGDATEIIITIETGKASV